MTDRDDGKGVAACFARDEEMQAAVAAMTGIQPVPDYTPDMLSAAEAAMGAAGALAGSGSLDIGGSVLSALARAWAALRSVAAAMPASALVLGFWPSEAGKDSDRVPGMDMQTLFAFPLSKVAGRGHGLRPGDTTAELPVRASLVRENGELALRLMRTGNNGPSPFVPVLNPERDAQTGLDIIRMPPVESGPSGNILINPAPPPPAASDTGNRKPVPVTPSHTGTTVNPVDDIVIITTPLPEQGPLQDFIYWLPDAKGTGVEPIYVVLGVYGDSNATGKYSGRKFHTERAGGPILNLDWRTAVIDRAGVDKVKLHTGRFGESADNQVMIARLEDILRGKLSATDTDKRFYTHEIRELERYRNLGIKDDVIPVNADEVWNNTHTATLEDYKIDINTQPLYTPEAEEAYRKQEDGK